MIKTSIPPAHEHPFAQYVRILGKGKKGTRSLTEAEAHDAMSMIMDGKVLDVQLGAFLMLMRVKEESPDELVGFVKAVQSHIQRQHRGLRSLPIDLDWSSYAGKRRHLPWYLLAVFTLANHGINVFIHGASGHTIDRIYTEDVITDLGFEVAQTDAQAQALINKENFCYFPLQHLCPKLHEIIELRNTMGLRSPVHTLARLLNPCAAPYVVQGIFHPSYRQVHQHAAMDLGYHHVAVIKGEAGEIERNPDAECLVESVIDGELVDNTWPAMFSKRHVKEASLDIDTLKAVWCGETSHEYGIAAVIGTIAIALVNMQKAATQSDALAQAENLWDSRNKGFLSRS